MLNVSYFQIDRTIYEATINKINEMFGEAESLGSRTYCESCFACLTAYISLMCMDTLYEKVSSYINMMCMVSTATVEEFL